MGTLLVPVAQRRMPWPPREVRPVALRNLHPLVSLHSVSSCLSFPLPPGKEPFSEVFCPPLLRVCTRAWVGWGDGFHQPPVTAGHTGPVWSGPHAFKECRNLDPPRCWQSRPPPSEPGGPSPGSESALALGPGHLVFALRLFPGGPTSPRTALAMILTWRAVGSGVCGIAVGLGLGESVPESHRRDSAVFPGLQ